MNNIELTIIMPVYNGERTILKTLNSFVPYMKNTFELIIIDDKSTDNTVRIIKEYAEKNYDKKIKLFYNKKNKGAGLSKNKGLLNARGKFVGFIDSDDYVQKNFFNNMLKKIRKNTDIVVSDIVMVNGDKISKTKIKKKSKKLFEKNILVPEDLLNFWGVASACVKIFRREMINDIKFSSKNSDDLIFTIPCIIKAREIIYCKRNKYYYNHEENSLTRTIELSKIISNTDAIFETLLYLINNNEEKNAYFFAINTLFPNIFMSILNLKIEESEKYYFYIKNTLISEEKLATFFKKVIKIDKKENDNIDIDNNLFYVIISNFVSKKSNFSNLHKSIKKHKKLNDLSQNKTKKYILTPREIFRKYVPIDKRKKMIKILKTRK